MAKEEKKREQNDMKKGQNETKYQGKRKRKKTRPEINTETGPFPLPPSKILNRVLTAYFHILHTIYYIILTSVIISQAAKQM